MPWDIISNSIVQETIYVDSFINKSMKGNANASTVKCRFMHTEKLHVISNKPLWTKWQFVMAVAANNPKLTWSYNMGSWFCQYCSSRDREHWHQVKGLKLGRMVSLGVLYSETFHIWRPATRHEIWWCDWTYLQNVQKLGRNQKQRFSSGREDVPLYHIWEGRAIRVSPQDCTPSIIFLLSVVIGGENLSNTILI